MMSCLYKNNVLLWSRPDVLDGYPRFMASSLDFGTYCSYNGKIWRTTPHLKGLKFTCIKFIKNFALAGTAGPYAYKSSDGGQTWHPFSTTRMGRMTSIAYGNGLALMSSIGESGTGNIWYLQYEQAGETWKKYEYDGPNVASLAFCGMGEEQGGYGQFFAGTENGIWVMEVYSGGATWQQVDDRLLNGYLWENVLWNKAYKGIFIASSMIGLDGRCGGIVYSEDSGSHWSAATIARQDGSVVDSRDGSWKTLSYGNGIFIAGSVGGSFVGTITSTDGKTWTETGDRIPWNAIQYGNGVFVGAVNRQGGDEAEHALGLMYSENSKTPAGQSPLKTWKPSNMMGREFYMVERIDSSENQFLTGTLLRYASTDEEIIASARLIGAAGVDNVGIMF